MSDVATRGSRLASVFDAQRPRLRAIAYRTLGSFWDADDAVQETWLRLDRADADEIDNLDAWLTTVVSRVSIDILRGRGAPRDELDEDLPLHDGHEADPETTAARSEEIGQAMLVVLDYLTPLERLSFVLHDMFALSYDDIAPIVERSPAAARQLASRARRRVRSVDVNAERMQRADAVTAFLKASREGDFGELLQLLDPEVELRADAAVISAASPYVDAGAPLLAPVVRGADAVARVFAGRAEQARLALIGGWPGAVYAPDGEVHAAYVIRFRDGRIVGMEVVGNPADVRELDITI
ncbi:MULTISPECIES: sigma-70 family RNA polymerase sigma factor [unclassified Microbacterium]|uniref:sigma-70 family RNA polymerase sigma factor n=1 Tax=unclassified Microbacterium TaxID=2609290 RepID=UPI000EA954E0|nr:MULTISPECIES: sigma-70 family RNA polymerase sigma factor [unclassified Microbacterium]MBT2484070.1 sigma-70 family RNA polymerase sigma factor [Microbacterium sp. ISL-108]RKN67022.1 sigma-70 family RNA polymerase sigma factor [Microbacterium sp. CGR2]